MVRSKRLLWIVAVMAALAGTAAAEETFALRDGDRVVFFGDSITDQRLYTTLPKLT
jgi:hypothetical protein